MRLCIVSSEYPPVTDYWGGIGAQYARLAPELARCGHELHVLTLPPSSGDAPLALEGVRIHTIPASRHLPWRAATRARAVAAKLHRLGPFDAIVAPEFRGEAALYAGSQDTGPLVTHLLTSTAQLLAVRPGLKLAERQGVNARLTLALERRQAERSAALIAPGSAILEWARDLWDLNGIPAHLIPLCIDVAEVRAAATAEPPPEFPRGVPVVSFASRLDGHKGAQHLVSAMKPIWDDHPDVRLAFVGRDAPWEGRMMSDHLRELAGGHADRIHFMGYMTNENYFACVARSDVIAIPSLWESFCIAAVEAMALGLPLVATRGHGFSEFVEHGANGLLVERGSVAQLEAALRELLTDPHRRRALGEAASHTAERLDARRVAPTFAAELERLLSRVGEANRDHAGRGAEMR